jgi:hypothetical protein
LQSALYLQPSVNNLNAYGYYSAVTTYGAYNVSSLVGMYGYTPVLSSASYTGTITNVMGAEVNAGTFPIGGDGKVNNTYGLYIQRVGGGIVSNWAIYDNTTSPSLLYSLNTTNTITTQNASSYANSVVCYLAGGTLGHCTSIVGVSGTCTCVGN